MNKREIIEKNIINENSKIVIGIGDSFCQGVGSESIETWEENNWDIEKMRLSDKGIKESYQNSMIQQLCDKYLTDFIPINLGKGGKGNKFAVNELLLNPLLNLDKAKEKIVIFVISGLERFDMVQNITPIHHESTTVWPFYNGLDRIGYGQILNDRDESIFNDISSISNLILDLFIIQNWCDLNNAKFIFISGFTPHINKQKFHNILFDKNVKDKDVTELNLNSILDKIKWKSQINPMGYDSMIQMLLHLENRDDLSVGYKFRDYIIEKHTEESYVSKCQHPTKKGYSLMSDIIFEHLKNF